ncbi:MAG: hypothetical protein HQM10_04870 [Candidatus Riflebacteria bacterium]|nr:hypothetical protein [Candidatus Riflebacteria bacterium]
MNNNKKHFFYQNYGLIIRSEIEFSKLLPAAENSLVDVEIQCGEIPEITWNMQSAGIRYEVAHGQLLIKVDNIADYYLSNGKNITIRPLKGVNEKEIFLFLFGTVFPALLQQRGKLVLHGAGIVINGKAVAICGKSGVGKSALTMAFLKNGYSVISDEHFVCSFPEKTLPTALAGFPQISIWKDIMEKYLKYHYHFLKVRNNIEKYCLDLENKYESKPVYIRAILFLETHKENYSELRLLNGSSKIEFAIKHTYGFNFIKGLGLQEENFLKCASITNSVPMYQLKRSKNPDQCEELVKIICRELCS